MKKTFLSIFILLAVRFAMGQCGTTINPPGAGNYLGLNGSNQSVTVPDSDDWFFSNGDFAIECWVNPANASTRTLLTQSVANAATAGTSSFYMSVNSNGSGTFDFYSTTGTTWTNNIYTPAGSVPAGVWSHLAITRTSGSVTMYVNGITATTTGTVAATIPNGNQPLGIGVQNGSLYFNGGLEEMRIYKGAGLTQTNVRDWMAKKMTASHPQWSSCVGYYRFDEATGSDVFDRKKCNNGAYIGSRTFAGSDAPVGDASAWNYSGNTSSANVLFGTGGQDSISANIVSGTAAGIHIYGVADTPNNRNNLPWLQDNNRYGGVWVVNGTNPVYSMAYGYANNPALVNTAASNFRLYKRISSNTLGWVEAPNSTNNTGSKFFTATGESTEYIMGGPNVVTPAAAVPNLTRMEYFFDTDPGFGNGVNAGAVSGTSFTFTNLPLSLSGLSAGMHNLFFRSRNADGKWSQSIPQTFYYEPAFNNPVQNISKAEYFFDTDPGFGNGTDAGAVNAATINLNITPTISSLAAGMHTFFMRTRDAAGKWSQSIPQTFYYEPIISNPVQDIVKAEYFFDTDPGFGNATNHSIVPGANISFSLAPTISSLSAGLHRFFIRTRDAAGKWSQSTPALFYYEPIISNPYPNITRAEYYIDNFVAVGNGIPVVFAPNDTINAIKFPVNITGVASGNHRLFLRTRDVNGKWSLTSWANFTLSGTSAAPTILINSFTPNTICAGNSIDVAFHATGNYVNGNMFTLQLSDNNGLFGTPVNLGNISSTVSTVINAVVPGSTSPNTYKLRVVSSNTAVTGATSDSSIVVLGASQSFMDSTIYLNCFNDTYNLTNLYNVSNGGVWNTPNPTVAIPGMYKYFVTAGGGCSDTADITLKLEVATWTGALNNDWHVPGNWNISKVPGLFTHVIVPTATPNPCIISTSDAVAASVQARGNGSFQIINTRKLVINGVCTVLPPN